MSTVKQAVGLILEGKVYQAKNQLESLVGHVTEWQEDQKNADDMDKTGGERKTEETDSEVSGSCDETVLCKGP